MAAHPKTVSIRKHTLLKYGIIDFDGLYKAMYQWLYEHKYHFEEPLSRIRPGTAAGVEYEFRWQAWRKINEYYKQNILIHMQVWDVKDIEVVKDGHKVKLTKCRIKIDFSGDIELDYTNRFGKTKFGKMLFNLYNTFILQSERQLATWWDELYYRVYKLQTIAKEYLDMEAKGNAYYDVW